MKILKSKKSWFVLAIILLGSFFTGRQIILAKKQLIKVDLKKAKTVLVERKNLEKKLTFAGKIDAQNYAVLRFQAGGLLSWLGVKEGDRVKKWQTVASLDKASLKKSFEKEMNDYMTARWNFEDTQDEYKSTKNNYLVTPEIQRILGRQQWTLNNSVLDLELSDIALKYSSLVSPISGIVTNIDYPESGINILPTNFSITVIDPASIYFKTEADEEDVTAISLNQEGEITIDSYPEETIKSEITDIAFAPIEGQSSTIYRVKFDLAKPNDNLKYRLGMNGDVQIKVAEAIEVLTLPVEAIYEENGEKFVYLRPNNKVEKRVIKTGLENDFDVEITEGLSEGEKVIYNE